MNTNILVGAYAAAPSLVAWNPAAETEYLDRVLGLPGVRGLELPWPGSLHAHDVDWLLRTLPASADLVVSDIGHTVGSLAKDAAYGLASNDSAGRARALADAARLRDDVDRLVQASGRGSVIAVTLHSAPLASAGSAEALRASLGDITSWDWNGADVLIEHCDALVAGQAPQKGYLPLADEIAAASGLAGLSMNWGRSAIELRDADAVAGQIARAAASGLLRGLVVSGATDTDNAFGPAWEDNHPPFAPAHPGEYGESTSLLTPARAADALAAAAASTGGLDWVAVKMGFRPLDAPLDDKLRMIAHAVDTVRALL